MPRDVPDLYRRATEAFGKHVHAVPDDRWSSPTPCSEWDVRALVNHLVHENRWAPQLFAGQTIAGVGDRFDGDLLGNDPKAAWDAAAAGAVAAVSDEGAMDRTVHLSFGDYPGHVYTMQLFADTLIHGWDLARAIGADQRMEPELADVCIAWFKDVEDAYRASGEIGPRASMPDGADTQTRLLAMFGRAS